MGDDLPICEWRINQPEFIKPGVTFEQDGKLWMKFFDGKVVEMTKCPTCKRTYPMDMGTCDWCEEARAEYEMGEHYSEEDPNWEEEDEEQ